MKRKEHICFLIFIAILIGNVNKLLAQKTVLYPSISSRKISPGKTNYYIDPLKGNDQNSGTSLRKPWKTFKPANQLIFSTGDQLIVTAPGPITQSLVLIARGSITSPVRISFAPGRYDFFPDSSFRKILNISNTNDTPLEQKAIAIYLTDSKNVTLNASGAKIVLRGKMIETCIDHCENINIKGISFDYQRPTMSEFTVLDVNEHYADLKINQDSRYSIKDSLLTWEGEGWRYPPGWYWQSLNLQTDELSRINMSLYKVKFVESNSQVRAYFKQNPGLKTGIVYQTRDVIRDCTGIFMQRSKNISLKNIRIYFMHGMGFLSQFCENISMDSVVVKPDEKSGRTSAAWADILHFSGCRGTLEIKNSYLSAANDDAINVHGTYLKIIEKLSPNQIKVRFMHNQTFGFNAFMPGDSINYIHSGSLLSFGSNLVLKSEMLNDKEIILTLKKTISSSILPDDAVENITWTPKVWIHHNTISRIPTRGILVSTRRKVIIENNIFLRTNLSGILIEDDAGSWFESGMVRDLIIRKNTFIKCGDPVISIHPENKVFQGAVHKNISITGNRFELKNTKPFNARNSSNILFSRNIIITPLPVNINELMDLQNCQNINVSGNKILKEK